MRIKIPTSAGGKEAVHYLTVPDDQLSQRYGGVNHRFTRLTLTADQLTRLDELGLLNIHGLGFVYDQVANSITHRYPDKSNHDHVTVVFDSRGYPVTTAETSSPARRFVRMEVARLSQEATDRLPGVERMYRFGANVLTTEPEGDLVMMAGATVSVSDADGYKLEAQSTGEMHQSLRRIERSYEWPVVLAAMRSKDTLRQGPQIPQLAATPAGFYNVVDDILPVSAR